MTRAKACERAVLAALAWRGRFEIDGLASDDQIDLAYRAFEVEIVEDDEIPGNLPALLAGKRLLLKRSLSRREKRHWKCHEFGHLCIHVGDQTEVAEPLGIAMDRQADEFAIVFLTGRVIPAIWREAPWTVADWLEIPELIVRKTWPLVQSLWIDAATVQLVSGILFVVRVIIGGHQPVV